MRPSKIQCVYCNSNDIEEYLKSRDYITGDNFNYFRCNKCFSYFLNPIPLNLDKYYFFNYRNYGFVGRQILNFLFNLKAKRILKLISNRKNKILEVGFGEGQLLKFLKLNSKQNHFIGLEREDYIKKNYEKISFIDELISDFKKIPKDLNLVILNNSLEHLPNPDEVLKLISNNLLEDGRILISVQNINSLQSKFGGSNWFHLDPPRHITQYSKRFFFNYFDHESKMVIESITNDSIFYEFIGWFVTLSNNMKFRYNLPWLYIQNLKKINLFFLLYLAVAIIFIFPLSIILTFYSLFFSKDPAIIRVTVKKI
tara:strand:- start:141 stop:1076 length:936 start_codon:yes stop_codon:yes gene_type:complete